MRTVGTKRLLILVKSVEPEGWQDQMGVGEHTTIPPLGTVNKNEELTSESDNSSIISGFLKSEPVRGGFEPLIGKTSLSFSNDTEKQDVQDISFPKQYSRGHDTYTGSLEFVKRKGDNRVLGAIDGRWNPSTLSYRPFYDFREFEFWVLENPDVIGLGVTKADLLVKHYFCVLDKSDEAFDIPQKHTVPVSRTMFERFPNWIAPASPQAVKTGVALTPGAITSFTQPREHTRLLLTPTGQNAAFTLKVVGRNVMEETQEENIAVGASATTVIGKKYFVSIDAMTIVGTVSAGTMDINDYDYKPR